MVDSPQPPRVPVDVGRYVQLSREGPCFVCAILGGHPEYPHHDVYEDAATIAFLARHPTLLGHCIVAPKRHVEDWVGGLGEEEYVALQRLLRRVAGALAKVVPVERMYCLSLGSQQGNAMNARKRLDGNPSHQPRHSARQHRELLAPACRR
jgi:hypothetical protein